MPIISTIQSKYEVARIARQNGNSDSRITPFFYSIYTDNRVKQSDTLTIAVANNPKYIIGCTVAYRPNYGAPYKEAHPFCYINKDEDYYSEIKLEKWSLSDIKIFQLESVDGATITLASDYNQSFTFYFRTTSPFRTVQQLWNLFIEIEENCNTLSELKIYYNYYLHKLEMENMAITLQEYQRKIEEQKALIKQHEELLERIAELVM